VARAGLDRAAAVCAATTPVVPLFVPAIGGLLVGFVVFALAREAKGHGVPEVIEAVSLGSGYIRPQIALVKSLISALTIGTGGSVGREGPIVHIGASLGSTLGQLLRVSPNRLPTLAGCGVAGGIAAVFNAPIAGAFFALEVVMGTFAMPAFGPVMLSSVMATVVSRAYFGDHPAFLVPEYTLLSVWELPLYLLVGITCGIAGLVFMSVLGALEEWFAQLHVPPLLKPVLGGLVLGGVILFVPNVYGIGYATMEAILRGGVPWWWLLLLLPAKMGATSLTLASGGSGGLFLPSLYLGSVIGSLVGLGAGAVLPTLTGPSGGYALVGMAAFLAGVIHCPITAFLLLFEITGSYSIILPLMVSCPVSTLVAKLFRDESIYTLELLRRGIDVRRREQNLMQAFTVGQVMRHDAPTLPETAPFADIVQHFLASQIPVCFVVDQKRQLLGAISIHDVKSLLLEEALGPLIIAKDLARSNAEMTTPGETLAHCLEKFAATEEEYLPVVSPAQELQGIISHRDVLDLYNREILRHEYLGLSLRSERISSTVHEQVRLPQEYTVEVIPVPGQYVAKTLRETQLRSHFSLTAVAIRRGGFHSQDELPDPDRALDPQDYLVVVGRPADVQRFTAEREEKGHPSV
jgi:CIC family chloride channel protein